MGVGAGLGLSKNWEVKVGGLWAVKCLGMETGLGMLRNVAGLGLMQSGTSLVLSEYRIVFSVDHPDVRTLKKG